MLWARMIWAFAREGGIPKYQYFRVINPSTRTPRRTVWLSVVVAFILGLPLLQVELLEIRAFPHAVPFTAVSEHTLQTCRIWCHLTAVLP